MFLYEEETQLETNKIKDNFMNKFKEILKESPINKTEIKALLNETNEKIKNLNEKIIESSFIDKQEEKYENN